MQKIVLAVWLLLKFIGVVCLLAILLYEEEEQTIQERAERFWKRLTDARNNALSRSAVFMRESARLTGAALDMIFGIKAVSVRLLGVSFYLSLASLSLLSFVRSDNGHLSIATPFQINSALSVGRLVCAALIPALAQFGSSVTERVYPWLLPLFRVCMAIWYAAFVWMLAGLIGFRAFCFWDRPKADWLWVS